MSNPIDKLKIDFDNLLNQYDQDNQLIINEYEKQLKDANDMSDCIRKSLIANLPGGQGETNDFGYRGYGQPRHSLVQRKKPKARRGRGRGRRM